MSKASTEAVQALDGLNLEGLRAEWRRLYGPPPKLRSVDLLRRLMAWRIEAEADPETVALLEAKLEGGKVVQTRGVLRAGVVVYREWQGVRHEVEVLDDGRVQYDGQTYDSLSAVARVITGVRWNGPRFFGMREAKSAKP